MKQNSALLLFCVFLSALSFAQQKYSLQDALRTAQQNNPTLQAERLNIDIAYTEVLSAKIRPNITFTNETIQVMDAAEYAENTSWSNAKNREEFWELSKPLQIAGQRKYKIHHAEKNAEVEEHLYFETQREVLNEVALKWLKVWSAHKQLEIIISAKENIDSLLIINQARFRNQVITKLDLDRTDLLANQYTIQYNLALQNILNNQQELLLLLGLTEEIEIDTEDDALMELSESIEALLENGFNLRSDLKAAKSASESTDANIRLQKALAYPQPEVGIIYNPMNAVPFLGFSASVELPFFDRNQGEIRKAIIEKEQSEKEQHAIEKQIETEIRIAYNNYIIQKRSFEEYRELMEQSQSILENVRAAYIKGGTTIIDFLEAQRSWLETQQQYYEFQQEFKESYVHLLYTTGLINQLAL